MNDTDILNGLIGLLEKVRDGGGGGEHWFREPDGKATCKNLLHLRTKVDTSGHVDVDTLYPSLVPMNAQSLILTVERGYLDMPQGGGAVSLRVMPQGYNLDPTKMLDRAKDTATIASGKSVDVVASDVRMPISPNYRKFFWALQSTIESQPDPDGPARMLAIIDLWGYAG